MLDWWNKRAENENAWLVDVKNLKKGFDLDMRNQTQIKT